jgi:hypothetical protein
MTVTRHAAALVAVLLLAGCWEPRGTVSAPRSEAATGSSLLAEDVPAGASDSRERASSGLKSAGLTYGSPTHLRVDAEPASLSLSARGVLRSRLLRGLADRYGFALVEWDDGDPRIDVELQGVSLERGLAHILDATPYALRYERPSKSGPTQLVALEVGRARDRTGQPNRRRETAGARGQRERGRSDDTYGSSATGRHRPTLSEADLRVTLERRARQQAERRRQRLDWLESEDPERRERAAFLIDAENAEERAMLAGLLRDDPSSGVRAEAARKLGFGLGEDQVETLVAALHDPAPEVLVQVLSALSWQKDPGLADSIDLLRRHSNADVRRSAMLATMQLTRGAYLLAKPEEVRAWAR